VVQEVLVLHEILLLHGTLVVPDLLPVLQVLFHLEVLFHPEDQLVMDPDYLVVRVLLEVQLATDLDHLYFLEPLELQ
jgi:hypothetical protein